MCHSAQRLLSRGLGTKLRSACCVDTEPSFQPSHPFLTWRNPEVKSGKGSFLAPSVGVMQQTELFFQSTLSVTVAALRTNCWSIVLFCNPGWTWTRNPFASFTGELGSALCSVTFSSELLLGFITPPKFGTRFEWGLSYLGEIWNHRITVHPFDLTGKSKTCSNISSNCSRLLEKGHEELDLRFFLMEVYFLP